MRQTGPWLSATVMLASLTLAACGNDASTESASSQGADDAGIHHLELSISREGLPPYPATYGNAAEQKALDTARAAERRRLSEAGRRVVRELAGLGDRSAEVVKATSIIYVRARLTREQARAARRLPQVAAVRPALARRGRLERYDVGWVLVTKAGERYALNWQTAMPTDLATGQSLAVEGLRDDGPAVFFAPDATGLLVREVRGR